MPPTQKKIDKPTIGINLDTLENEGDKPPFGVVVHGKRIEMFSPDSLDFRVLNLIREDILRFFEHAMSDEDFKHFTSKKVTVGQVTALEKGYTDYFGIEEPGDSGASPA